ncbi:MAG: NUDIX domain-containing protein [Proteobacteria bacterium]|nr:NUDIX domain-containing protein [Pseudomonadota bacterium]
MAGDQYLEVVDEADAVVGRELRSVIHRDGLRHREVHVWFLDKTNSLIFQKRAMDKDTNPGLLTSTAGGHVEIGQSYLNAALMEVQEETGVALKAEDLQRLCKLKMHQDDLVTGLTNKVFREVYLYPFDGTMDELTVEEDAADGFISRPLAEVLALTPESADGFVASLFSEAYRPVWNAMRKLVA